MIVRQKIMILDPSPIFRRTLKSVIETSETFVEVIEAEDTDAARHILKSKVPDVVFLDIALPGENGIRFIAHVKKAVPEARVVVLTSHDSEEHEAASLEKGADVFLSKERSGSFRLLDTIRAVVRRHESKD